MKGGGGEERIVANRYHVFAQKTCKVYILQILILPESIWIMGAGGADKSEKKGGGGGKTRHMLQTRLVDDVPQCVNAWIYFDTN